MKGAAFLPLLVGVSLWAAADAAFRTSVAQQQMIELGARRGAESPATVVDGKDVQGMLDGMPREMISQMKQAVAEMATHRDAQAALLLQNSSNSSSSELLPPPVPAPPEPGHLDRIYRNVLKQAKGLHEAERKSFDADARQYLADSKRAMRHQQMTEAQEKEWIAKIQNQMARKTYKKMADERSANTKLAMAVVSDEAAELAGRLRNSQQQRENALQDRNARFLSARAAEQQLEKEQAEAVEQKIANKQRMRAEAEEAAFRLRERSRIFDARMHKVDIERARELSAADVKLEYPYNKPAKK